jgi:hypothetical protein
MRHAARMGEKGNAHRILVESQKERDQWEDKDVGVWIILKWILDRLDGMVCIILTWLRIKTSTGLL